MGLRVLNVLLRRSSVAIAAVFAILLAPTSTRSEKTLSLEGTYSVEENGKLFQLVRVERRDDRFLISIQQNGDWMEPRPTRLMGKSDLQKLIKEPVTVHVVGLGNDSITLMLFKVPKGWRWGKFECKTGYWLLSALGPIELYKD